MRGPTNANPIGGNSGIKTLIDNTDFKVFRWGQTVHISFINHTPTQTNTPYYAVVDARVPRCICNTMGIIMDYVPNIVGEIWINPSDYKIGIISSTTGPISGSMTYITNDP